SPKDAASQHKSCTPRGSASATRPARLERGMAEITVRTVAGVVRGNVDRGVQVFLGIPYGAPTTGANRFRPPRAALHWDGVLDADEYPPSCPQGTGERPVTAQQRELHERAAVFGMGMSPG